MITCKVTHLAFIRDLLIVIKKRASVLAQDVLANVFYLFWLRFFLIFIIRFKIRRIRIVDYVIILEELN